MGGLVRQQIDRTVGTHVDGHGAVDMAAADGPIVDTDLHKLTDCGSRIARTRANNVDRDTSTASCRAILAPGRPPIASPTRVSNSATGGLRR